MGEVMWIGLTSSGTSVSQSDLRVYAETTLRQSLTTIPGISNLLIMGGSSPQYTISVDPAKLSTRHITMTSLESSLSNITNPGGAGIALTATSEFPVNLKPIGNTIEKIGSITLPDGGVLRDVATVDVGQSSQRRGDALIDGTP